MSSALKLSSYAEEESALTGLKIKLQFMYNTVGQSTSLGAMRISRALAIFCANLLVFSVVR